MECNVSDSIAMSLHVSCHLLVSWVQSRNESIYNLQ
jgi:hypothetical protein